MADRIICSIYNSPKALNNIILSPTLLLAGTLSSYFLVGGTFPSYSPLLIVLSLATVVQKDLSSFLSEEAGVRGPVSRGVEVSSPVDKFEDLGGNGTKVAAYLRVSTGRQAKKGFSLEAQRVQLEKLKAERNASQIYWFVDAGKSGRDFDKRKLNAIMDLKERGEIDEFWVASVDRIGRECRKLLLFFLNLCNDGVIIRTPERKYDLKNLSSLLTLIIEAHDAQKDNERRAKAAMAGKAQAFKQRHWNKPVPAGYRKSEEGWLEKIPDWGPLIDDTYTFLKRTSFKPSFEAVKNAINEKYRGFLPKPLTRHQTKRMLTDPVYIGNPQHLGEVVLDPSLTYVDEKTFNEVQKIVERIHRKHSHKKSDAIKELIKEHGIEVIDFIPEWTARCRFCGSSNTVKNGTVTIGNRTSYNFFCKDCKRQFRIPTKAQRKRIQEWASKHRVPSPLLKSNKRRRTKRKQPPKLVGKSKPLDEFW